MWLVVSHPMFLGWAAIHKLLKRPKMNLGLFLCIIPINVNSFLWAQFLLMLMRYTLEEKKTDLPLLQVFSSVAWEWTSNNKIYWLHRQGIIHLLLLFSFCFGFAQVVFLEIYKKKYNYISCLSSSNCLFNQGSPMFSVLQDNFSFICRTVPVANTWPELML